jgi:hypothetical protein
VTIVPQCARCKNLAPDAFATGLYRCRAFPDAIPVAIQMNEHDHRRPYPDDRGIRFEPKKDD